jgi:hypothetical protein
VWRYHTVRQDIAHLNQRPSNISVSAGDNA